MQDKREALLNSALELFSSRGYQNTPTSLISKNAGVATGTLFHHFSSKEVLINQLYLDCKMKLLSSVTEKLKEDLSIEEKLQSVWEIVISWALNNENRVLFLMQHQNASFINKETRQEAESQLAPLMALVHEAVEDQFIRSLPEDLMGEMLGSLLMGSVSFFLKNREKFNRPEYREGAYDMFINAIKKK